MYYIPLTENNIKRCKDIGIARRQNAKRINAKVGNTRRYYSEETRLYQEWMGACGELSSKYYCDGVVPFIWNEMEMGQPDFAGFIDAKTTDGVDNRVSLILRDNDPLDRAYILVYSNERPLFRIVGWCWGHEGKQKRFIHHGDPVRPPAYFVPPDADIIKRPYELLFELRKRGL